MIDQLNRETFNKLYVKEGKSLDEIAEMISCSPYTVKNWFKQYGISLRKSRRRKIDIDEAMLYRLCFEEGKSMTEIAKIFDCAIGTISRRAKRLGLRE